MNRRKFFQSAAIGSILAGIGALFACKPPPPPPSPVPVKQNRLDRVGLRRVILCICQDIERLGRSYAYEINDKYTREHFNHELTFLLNCNYVGFGAIHSFEIVNDETTNTPTTANTNSMVGYVMIQKEPGFEYVRIDFRIP